MMIYYVIQNILELFQYRTTTGNGEYKYLMLISGFYNYF